MYAKSYSDSCEVNNVNNVNNIKSTQVLPIPIILLNIKHIYKNILTVKPETLAKENFDESLLQQH